jgi:hypothetical protein
MTACSTTRAGRAACQPLQADQGLNTLPERATFEDGGNGVEAGVIEMLDRMQTGRFKVFAHLKEWFDEFRLYHRKDGKIVKERDDLLSATRYAVMMKRFAEVEPSRASVRRAAAAAGWAPDGLFPTTTPTLKPAKAKPKKSDWAEVHEEAMRNTIATTRTKRTTSTRLTRI